MSEALAMQQRPDNPSRNSSAAQRTASRTPTGLSSRDGETQGVCAPGTAPGPLICWSLTRLVPACPSADLIPALCERRFLRGGEIIQWL